MKLNATTAQNSFKYTWLLSRIFPYIRPYQNYYNCCVWCVRLDSSYDIQLLETNEGELVEIGTHEELMQIADGQYKMLYEMQFKKQECLT